MYAKPSPTRSFPALMTRLLILSCAALCSFPYKGTAQELLPAVFQRVTGLSQVSSTGYCMIGALNENGQLHFMSTQATSKNKLLGVKDTEGVRNTLEGSEAKLVWQIKMAEPGICTLTDALGGKGTLRRVDDQKLGLSFSAEADELSLWNIEENGNGTFRLSAPSQPASSRNLAISRISDTAYGFDNYATSNSRELYLFMRQETTTLHDGMTVALGHRDYYRDRDGQPHSTETLLLTDRTIAPDDDLATYTVGLLAEGGFTLYDAERGGYLDYGLTLSANAAEWQTADGYIQTCEPSPRRIGFLPQERWWSVLSPEAYESAEAEAAVLHPVAEPPQREDADNGVCTLSGGWSADALRSITCDRVRCLDLTQIALPQQAKDFENLPSESNIPIFLKESEAQHAPASWRFVVKCGKDENSPTTTLLLSDRQSLYTDRRITFATGTLYYRRRFPAGRKWQTICLPFKADVPENCELLQFGGIDDDGILTFEPAQEIKPQTAYIISLRHDAPAQGKLVDFINTAPCVLTPDVTATPPFEGTFQNQSITSSSERIYMLHPDGSQFIAAGPGSSLPAFRAWIRPESNTNMRAIQWKQIK